MKAHPFSLFALVGFSVAAGPANAQLTSSPPAAVDTFFKKHCYDCHEGEAGEGGLDLTSLPAPVEGAEDAAKWVRIFDRVQAGEMPPQDAQAVDPNEAEQFLQVTASWLRQQQQWEFAQRGRVRARRLTNLQLERSLYDLLGIDIPLAARMPDEPRTASFSNVADGQPMSRFQLEQHLAVLDAASDEAFRRALGTADEEKQHLPARSIARRRAKSRTREPELIDGHAVTWSSRMAFYGRVPATTARDSGWYRFTFRAKALNRPADHGVWCTVRTGRCVASAALLEWVGAFEATDEPKEFTFETWLPQGHMLEIRPGDATLKVAKFRGGQVGTGEGGPQNVPGVAIEWLGMERFHRGLDNDQVRRLLFGDLEVQSPRRPEHGEVVSHQPRRDAARLLDAFASRAFRREVATEDLQPYVDLVHSRLDKGDRFVAAMRSGYRALLCSPRFLYFHEQPGKLDDYAIATRLSYFL